MLVLSSVANREAHPSPRFCVMCWESGASARFHLYAQIYLLGIAYTWTPKLNRGSRTTYLSTWL